MQTAVIYARFSCDRQSEQSIDGQLRVCKDFAKSRKIKIVGEYIDRALTGKSDDRPQFQTMIDDAKKKTFDYVIVYKLDRFARNRYDSAIYKSKLKQFGVKVLSAMENIGDNPESILLEGMLESWAEYYSIDLSQKVRRGLRESAMKGQFVAGRIPLGYKIVNKKLEIDPKTAPIVKEIFTRYAAGEPKKAIINDLNERGYRNLSGEPFGHTAFQHILKCEKYIGTMRYSDIVIENGCPAIIDQDTFDHARDRLKSNRQHARSNAAKVDYLLSGKIFCGPCGSSMIGNSGKSRHGEIYWYYSCAERRKNHTCKKKNERKDFIEWYVVEQTLEYVLNQNRMDHIAEILIKEYDNEFDNRKLKDLEKRIDKLQRDINKYTDLLLDAPVAARDHIYNQIETSAAIKSDLEIDLRKLRIACGIRFTKKEILAWLKQFCAGDPLDEEFRRKIIDVFINSVYLYDDRIAIFYNIKNGRQISYFDVSAMVNDSDDLISSIPEEIEGSTTNPQSGLCAIENKPHFVFIAGLFGIILSRQQLDKNKSERYGS